MIFLSLALAMSFSTCLCKLVEPWPVLPLMGEVHTGFTPPGVKRARVYSVSPVMLAGRAMGYRSEMVWLALAADLWLPVRSIVVEEGGVVVVVVVVEADLEEKEGVRR